MRSYLILLYFLLSNFALKAQETAFVKGDYLEFALNADGVFYTNQSIPAGFHTTNNELGIVADPDKDGWETGSPNYYGDYFAQGAPIEGFAIQVGEKVYSNNAINSKAGVKQAFKSKAFENRSEGSNHVITYLGEIEDKLEVEQIVEFEKGNTKIKFTVSLKNLDSSGQAVYYSRFADSDASRSVNGSFLSSVSAKFQKERNRASVIQATGEAGGGYFSMFSTDPRSKVTSDATWFASPKSLYQKTTSAENKVEDANVNLVFELGMLAPNQQKTIVFYYLFEKAEENVLCGGDCSEEVIEMDNDTFIHSFFPESNFSDSPIIQMSSKLFSNQNNIVRTLYKPDLSQIPFGSVILDAKLSLYAFFDEESEAQGHVSLNGSNEVNFFPIINDWTLNQVNWENQPEIMKEQWVILPSSEGNATKNYTDIDVTDLIRYLYNNPESTYGFMMKLNQEVGSRSMIFASSNNRNIELRPKLTIFHELRNGN